MHTERATPPQPEPSEAELIAQARAGVESAVRALVQRNNQQMFRIARGILHSDADAEDAVQAGYVNAFTKLEKFRGDASFSTWLTRIVMNEAYGRLRRQRPVVDLNEYREGLHRSDTGEWDDQMAQHHRNPESELARSEVRKFLEQAIDALPESFRLVYILRDVQEMPAREVAGILGIKAVTVKTRLFRARRLLRTELRKSLTDEFSAIFPFDGARCAGMADRVMHGLRARHDND